MLAGALGAHRAVGVAWSSVTEPRFPYENPAGLVHLELVTDRELHPGAEHLFRDEVDVLVEQGRAFAWVGRWLPARLTMGSRVVRGAEVDAGLLETLGVPPRWGRPFREDDHLVGMASDGFGDLDIGAPVVLLGHDLAVATAGDPGAAVGTEVVLDGVAVRVVGVMPPEFFFPDAVTEVWLPAARRPPPPGSISRSNAFTFARVREGLTPSVAVAEATTLLRAAPLRTEDERVVAVPLGDELARPVRPTVAILRAGTLLLVLAAGVSVAGLRLARAEDEARQSAVARSLGAAPADELAAPAARIAIVASSVAALGWLASFAVRPVVETFALGIPGESRGIPFLTMESSS